MFCYVLLFLAYFSLTRVLIYTMHFPPADILLSYHLYILYLNYLTPWVLELIYY